MKPAVTKFLAVVVVLAALGACVGFVWLVVLGVQHDPGLVGSLATASSAVIAVAAERFVGRNREINQQRRERIAPLYEALVERLRNAEEIDDVDEMVTFFKEFSVSLIMFAPAGLIKAWIELARHEWPTDGSADPVGVLLYEQVLRAIRKDMGHRDRWLGVGDLQRLYVTDIDEAIGTFEPLQNGRLVPPER